MVRIDNLEIVAQNAGILIKEGLYKHSSREITSYELIFVRKGCLKMFEGENILQLMKVNTSSSIQYLSRRNFK